MNTVLGRLQTLAALGQSLGSQSADKTLSSDQKSFWETFQSIAGQSVAGKLGVPESMDSIFKEAAEKYDVPLNLLMAVGKAESGYNANAVSSAGAQGVMQLMPATAAALGVENAFDARSNIMGGAKYLAQKLQQYNGNIDLTLAAYNAGSGNVEKYGGVPPFEETRNYISRIRQYMGQELSTGQTVQASTGSSVSQSQKASGTVSGTASDSDLTLEMAEYIVGMMRLQMMSRVSSLGKDASLGGLDSDSNSTNLWQL